MIIIARIYSKNWHKKKNKNSYFYYKIAFRYRLENKILKEFNKDNTSYLKKLRI
ncbi:hypothetical protein Cs308_0089 [Candidatus Chlamydia sanziniae]|uniref:Uncharacterized protein n=1 Tax=Candidatus Chlamydia sanziniae TaxID=1806891 RepID=A0A1A9HTE3_9CHLA|nr:hypothetical protein Cs308_0089 [Candidatus Chlamydia sanziniae]